ncbi:hypothetical protein [Chitinophaga terrae (ex Kim and Jung 2007)]|uniref:hypothetical protein n=1 Tax=Chitinophaga terrae (ex Kim and Jung 2007) TaxID=408074 RepID=UPI001456C146|nr:hypothetical protein [Chitinophaga terrae (ex Kim and Jung 2007)]MDQ0109750.1 hypothetical protein [Chitinophaga terrae (ex Kim and Jung 2007)]
MMRQETFFRYAIIAWSVVVTIVCILSLPIAALFLLRNCFTRKKTNSYDKQ